MDIFVANRQSEFLIVAFLSTAWALLYLAFRNLCYPSLSADYSNKVVSFVHAVLGFVWPLFNIEWNSLRSNVGTETTDGQLMVLRCSLSYFVYDFICLLTIEYGKGIDLSTTFHHLVTIALMFVGVFLKVSGHEIVLGLMLMEASNPCMYLIYLLRELKLGKTRLARTNFLLFASLFLLSRNILCAPLVWWTVTSPSPPLLVKAISICMAILNWYWAHQVFRCLQEENVPKNGTRDVKVE
jgi:hypothetical protein